MGGLRDVIGHHSCDALVERPRVRYWAHQESTPVITAVGETMASEPRREGVVSDMGCVNTDGIHTAAIP